MSGTFGFAGRLVVGNSFIQDKQNWLSLQNNSSLTITNDMLLGVQAGTWAQCNIDPGSTLSVGGNLTVGDAGSGNFYNSGTVQVAGELIAGNSSSGSGVIGSSSNSTSIFGSATIGLNGTGSFSQFVGGTVTINGGLTLGVNSGSYGSYNLQQVTGSQNLLNVGSMLLGQNPGSEGSLSVHSGNTATIMNSLVVGDGGRGVVSHDGGEVTAGSVTLGMQGGSEANYDLRNGSLTTGNLVVGQGNPGTNPGDWGATFNQGGDDLIGPTVTVTGALTVGAGKPEGWISDEGRRYRYGIWKGTLDVHDLVVGTGTFAIKDAAAVVNVSGDFTLGADGRVEIVPGGNINMTGSNFSVESTDPDNMAGLQNLRMVFLGGEEVTDNFEVGFNLGALEIGPGSHVKLVDLYDNALGVTDALYVDSFTLGEGSTLDLNDLLLYVKNGETYDLVNPGDFGGQIVNTHAVTNNSGNYDIFPQVNEDGCILWQGYDGNDYELFFQAPGESVIQLTDNGTADVKPQMNAAAHMVWMNWDGNDWEVWHNLGSGPVQLTDNTFYDVLPQITGDDQIYWQSYDGNDYEICRYDPESETTTQLTDNGVADVWPQANQSGHLTWMEWDGNNWQVWYDTGSGPVQLTTTGSNERPQITEDGQIFWQTWDGQDFEICRYNPSTSVTSQITDNAVDDVSPTMNNGILVWSQWDGYYWQIFRDVLNTGIINQITNDSYNNKYPRVSPSGQIVWQKWDGSDYEVYTYQ